MTEKSGVIKSRKVGSKTSEMDIPMEGFGIEDKDEEKSEENDDADKIKEGEMVVNMRIPSQVAFNFRNKIPNLLILYLY